jgi:hypothetical protein
VVPPAGPAAISHPPKASISPVSASAAAFAMASVWQDSDRRPGAAGNEQPVTPGPPRHH